MTGSWARRLRVLVSAVALASIALVAGCADVRLPGRATGTVPAASAALTQPTPPGTPTPRRIPATETITLVATPDPTVTPLPPTSTSRPAPTPTSTATAARTSTPPPASAASGPQRSGQLVLRGDPKSGAVALTCDAGLTAAGGTAQVLDTFKAYGARSTFFLTGEWAAANPALVRRMRDEGHELANHTYDHPNLTEVSDQIIRTQVARTEKTIVEIAGVEPARLLRPPFGAYDRRVLATLGSIGYEVIYWSLDSGDWRDDVSAEQVAYDVGSRTVAGDIVVMHCYSPKTAKALPAAMKRLSERGLRFETVSALIAHGGSAPAVLDPAPVGSATARPSGVAGSATPNGARPMTATPSATPSAGESIRLGQ